MKELFKPISLPRWYQDLSIPQMQKVFELGDIMRADYAERVTERTQQALGVIGVTSTFIKITSEQIKELRRLVDLDPVKFLSEIYRIVTGSYFVNEEYKKFYDCNERIILSAIAFLTLPEIIIELHKRIPMGPAPKLPPKPLPQKILPRRRATSPYLETLILRPDRITYRRELHRWKQQCQAIPKPRVILPPWINHLDNFEIATIAGNERSDKTRKDRHESYHEEASDKRKDNGAVRTIHDAKRPDLQEDRKIFDKSTDRVTGKNRSISSGHENKSPETKKGTTNHLDYSMVQSDKPSTVEKDGKKNVDKRNDYSQSYIDKSLSSKKENRSKKSGTPAEKSHPLQDQSKEHFDKITESRKKITVSGATENKIDNRLPEYSRQPHSNKKSWLGEKETQLLLTGITETADYPISCETAGLAYVTPDNSDENFFAALNLPENKKKKYPRGREYLSRKWQEWLRAADEDFMNAEKYANEIINSIKDTLKLMGPEISCDTCCSCRQTKKANIKYHKTKTPRVVIDSIAIDGKQNKHIVGSLSMNSPAPSPTESSADIPEVIPSHDKVVKTKIISGVTNEMGETKYFVSGLSKEIEHVSKRVISNSKLRKPIKNVPPCGCAIEKLINEGLTEITSEDNIPWSKIDESCIGKKYRPRAIENCQKNPSEKICRRNPFKKNIDEKIRAALRRKDTEEEDDYPRKKKNLYSLAEFQPCGDEDGMAVCGGPWGAINVPDAEELARREAEAKLILQSPPCGDKPGRSICGAPFGERHPLPKKRRKNDDEDEDEEEEEEVDEEDPKERKKREREERKKRRESKVEKLLNRDERCSTVDKKIGEEDKSDKPTSFGKIDKYPSKKIARTDKKNKSSEDKSEYDSKATARTKRQSSESNDSTKGKTRRRSKEEKKQDALEEERILKRAQRKEVKNHWNRMTKMANKFIESPIHLPEETRICKREEIKICCKDSEENNRVIGEESASEGPFGWRTKSEEALPTEKTLIYLVNPEEPVETIPVRAGGKPCKCRENRNKRKTLLYNINTIVSDGKNKREANSPVIDGLIYITPTPSIQITDEYIPEYELEDSPHEICAREQKNSDFRYVEQYLGPKSLMKKSPISNPCECSSPKQKTVDVSLKQNENSLLLKESIGSPEKNWKRVFGNESLINFYSRCRDNVPCWLRCVEFSKTGCCSLPRTLRIKKPVCECRYERKILKREEEKKDWLCRQEKLKKMKKVPYEQVTGLSRPMRTETNVVISNVTRTQREDENVDDINYCVSGVTQDRVMGPQEFILGGVGMHTPLVTPEISKVEIPIPKPHRHWSPTNIHEKPNDSLKKGNQKMSPINMQNRIADSVKLKNQLRESEQTDRRNKLNDNKDKKIDVLFKSPRGNVSTGDDLEKKKPIYRVHDKKLQKDNTKGKTSKIEKVPVEPVVRAPKGKTSLSIPAESRKKSLESNEVPHKSQTAGPVPAESKLKSFTKKIEEIHKNGHTRKSTGNIPSQEKREESQENKKEFTSKIDLEKLMQIELEKMAEEGFLFAKLPACHQMPQLRYWIMYRKGVAFPPEEKKRLMDQSIKIWNDMEKSKTKKIVAPEIKISKTALENLTFDDAEKIKRDVASKKAIFYSNLRKSRVLAAQKMWNLMEFGKFPGVKFKKAFFTYQASKESDGFVFKPWENK